MVILALSLFIQWDLRRISPAGNKRAFLLLLTLAFMTVFGTLLSYWWMWLDGCPLFHQWEFDAISTLGLGLFLAIYLVGAIILSLRYQLKGRKILAIAKKCQQTAVLERFYGFCQQLSIKPYPDLYLIDVNRPFAASFSIFKPVILLSTYIVKSLDQEELDAVLIHELAHIKGQDVLATTWTRIIRDLLWFVPGIFGLYERYLLSLELQADWLTASLTRKPGALASALVRFEKEGTVSAAPKDAHHLFATTSGVRFINEEDSGNFLYRLNLLLEEEYSQSSNKQIPVWKLRTLLFAILWLTSLVLSPYCYLFPTCSIPH